MEQQQQHHENEHEHDQHQQQLRRPRRGEGPIRYCDVFDISDGDQLAGKPISPRDASAMQSAENKAFGQTVKGGPASLMQSAATKNVQAGLVGPNDSSDAVPGEQQRVGEPHVHVPMATSSSSTPERSDDRGRDDVTPGGAAITIGEALEAAAGSMGEKPVDHHDAAAISAAEMRATGMNAASPDSLGVAAEAAAMVNDRIMDNADKTTVSEIIKDAKSKLSRDKPVDRRDAALVTAAEMKGEAEGVNVITDDVSKRSMTPGGVAHAVSSAARINQCN